ncbi:MAG: TonB-dependent receptor [Bryobacteraceae bacterium]
MRVRCYFLALLILLSGVQQTLFAQGGSASLSGTVNDPSGAIVPGATVQATKVDTNTVQTTQTNAVGLYTFPRLAPGRYRISIKSAGFKEFIVTDVVLHVGDTVSQNFKMELGAATESVSVAATAVLLNTEDGTVGTVIERKVIESMPLNGRSFQGLITLSPGVATVAPSSGSSGQFVVNGQRTDTNYFTVDGVSANVGAPTAGSLQSNGVGATPTNSSTGGFNNMVSVDALQEFVITTSNFAPEFGRTPGGQISLVSRGGTNSFHGTAFEYLRNTVLDANDWFLNAAGKDRGIVQQNDFGGVFGGPIKRNKLFFFASYEGLRLQAPTPSVKKVPTQSARDLAKIATLGGVTGYMAQFANAYPLPDGNPSTVCTNFTNCQADYTASFPGKSSLDSYSGRLDYTISQKMSLFGRYSHGPSDIKSDNSVFRTSIANTNEVYTAGWTVVPTTSTTNDLRFNYTSSTTVRGSNPLNYTGSLSTIYPSGFAQPPAEYLNNPSRIGIAVSGFVTDAFSLAPGGADNSNAQINIVDTFGWVKGSHRFRFGADFRQFDPSVNQNNYNGGYTFAQNSTAQAGLPAVANVCPAGSLPASAGTTIPGYICGQATLANIQRNYLDNYRYRQYSFFAQDTWKLSRRLTMTYGVRWDINPPYSWTSNNDGFSVKEGTFSKTDVSKIQINPFGTSAYKTTWGNFAPRIGVAYQLSDNPRWGRVLRAGWGLFYDTGSQIGSGVGTPYSARFNNTGSGTIARYVNVPVSLADTLYVTPPIGRTDLPVSNGGLDYLADPNFTLPYVHQMNVTLEQQLWGKQTLQVGYVGGIGRGLLGALVYPANSGNPAVFAQINPITGAITTDSLILMGNYSTSDYHSLQTKFQRQFSRGLSFITSYTWSHSIDDLSNNGPRLTAKILPTAAQLSTGLPTTLLRGNSDFDIRHNLALSMVFDIPSPANAFARAILGHWSFDPIYHFQSSSPMDLLSGTSGAIGGTSYSQRPNLIPGVPVYVYGDECATQNGGRGCPGGFALNRAPVTAAMTASAGCLAPTATNAKGAFCTPATVGGQVVSGNLGRNVIQSFSLQELDLSLHRDFVFTERFRLRFQFDLFNVFNHPQFGTFSSTLNNAAFGTVTNMANSSLGSGVAAGNGFNPIFSTGGPRNAQFALKLYF